MADLSGINLTAHQFQEWIPKKFEVRLIAVGRKLFAVAIYTDDPAAFIDWRSNYAALDYKVIQVPDRIAFGVRLFMSSAQLTFTAMDFVVTQQDEWVFLESNAGGQYGWLTPVLGNAVTDAIADLLARGEI